MIFRAPVLAAHAMVGAHQLPRRLDGLRSAGSEEDALQAIGRERGNPRRKLDRPGMGIAPGGEERELPRLLGGSIGQLGAAMAAVHAEQRRQPVEIAFGVLVVDIAAVAAHDDRDLTRGVAAHAREVHPQMAPGEPLQIAGFTSRLGQICEHGRGGWRDVRCAQR
jgi:hypothetical protein